MLLLVRKLNASGEEFVYFFPKLRRHYPTSTTGESLQKTDCLLLHKHFHIVSGEGDPLYFWGSYRYGSWRN